MLHPSESYLGAIVVLVLHFSPIVVLMVYTPIFDILFFFGVMMVLALSLPNFQLNSLHSKFCFFAAFLVIVMLIFV